MELTGQILHVVPKIASSKEHKLEACKLLILQLKKKKNSRGTQVAQ